MQLHRYELAIILTLTTLFYLVTLQFGFLWDDKLLILENPALTQTINFKEIFFQSLWKFSQTQSESTSYYRPLVSLLNVIQFKMFGSNAWGYHFFNLLLHLSVVSLVWVLGKRFELSAFGRQIACLIFAIHPVQSSTVAYISCQGDLLATFFSLIAFLLWIHPKQMKWIALSFALAALLSKEIAVITPLVLILHDILIHKVNWKKLQTYAPLVVYAMYFPLRWLALDTSSELNMDFHLLHSPGSFRILRWISRIFLPIPISPNELPILVPAWLSLLCHASLILIIFLVYNKTKLQTSRFLGFACIWFLLALLPIADYPNQQLRFSDQLLYFSMIPVSLGLASLVSGLRASRIALFVIVVFFIPISYANMSHWKSDLTLWQRIMKFDPHHIENHLQYASVLKEAGLPQEGCNHLLEISKKIGTQEKAFTYRALYHNLGNCYMDSRPELAEQFFLESLQFAGHEGWATRINLILIQLKLEKNNEALLQAQQLTQEKPNLDVSWQMLEQVQQAIKK